MKKLLSAITLLTLLFPFNILANTSYSTTITVLSTADLHARIYPYNYTTDLPAPGTGVAVVNTVINNERAINPNLILLDSGDSIQGDLMKMFNHEEVHPMVNALNIMGTDVWTLGNHEFNFGLDVLNPAIDNFDGNVIVANIYTENGNRWLEPYIIYEIDGVRVAIVGLITPHIPRWEASNPEHFEGLIFTDPLEEAQKVMNELEGKADVIIGNFHLGLETQYTETDGAAIIAEQVDGFDVIFVAHAHDTFDDVVINNTRLIEPGHRGTNVAKASIDLERIDNQWVVVNVNSTNLNTQDVLPDPYILETFEYIHISSLEEINRVAGYVLKDFINGVDYITGSNTNVTTMPRAQLEETAIINFINEVQMFYTGADISGTALFSFNSTIEQGDFLKKDIVNVYRFDNTLFGINITGENLINYLEWSASYYNTFTPGDVTVSFNPNIPNYNYDMFSGINYKIDISKEPGERITDLKLNGEEINLEANYKLAVNNYRLGTLISYGWATLDDVYYDSTQVYSDGGHIQELILGYIQNELDGKLEPKINNNWEIIGADIDPFIQEQVFELVRSGELVIPVSSDERSMNAQSLNYFDLISAGYDIEIEETAIHLEHKQHIVKPGDTLWHISNMFNTNYLYLAEYNHINNPNLIFPGQVINIP